MQRLDLCFCLRRLRGTAAFSFVCGDEKKIISSSSAAIISYALWISVTSFFSANPFLINSSSKLIFYFFQALSVCCDKLVTKNVSNIFSWIDLLFSNNWEELRAEISVSVFFWGFFFPGMQLDPSHRTHVVRVRREKPCRPLNAAWNIQVFLQGMGGILEKAWNGEMWYGELRGRKTKLFKPRAFPLIKIVSSLYWI